MAIDVVMLVSGEPLAAKPARIIAGHEPEKTNELLQAIAKCCLNKVSPAIKEHRVTKLLSCRICSKPFNQRMTQDWRCPREDHIYTYAAVIRPLSFSEG